MFYFINVVWSFFGSSQLENDFLVQLYWKSQFRAKVPLWVLPYLDTAYQVELKKLLAIVSGYFLLFVGHWIII